MFKAMCAEETEDEQGNAPKRSATRRDSIFPDYVRAFLLSVAWGVVNNARQAPGESKHWVIRTAYLTPYYEPYRQMIKSKFGLSTEREILDLMVEFAEAGVRALYDEFKKTGQIDFVRLSRLGST